MQDKKEEEKKQQPQEKKEAPHECRYLTPLGNNRFRCACGKIYTRRTWAERD